MAPRLFRWRALLALLALALGLAATALWRLSVITPVPPQPAATSLYDLTATHLDGRPAPLGAFRGQVALVVNVASECSLATQYPGLDALYRRYRDRGFVVLAFPSNDFWQEPNDEAGIRQVCDAHGVSFPVFARSHVRGPERSPVYRYLAASGETPLWNFAKYLVGRDGRPRAFFGSLVGPDHQELVAAIERALQEPWDAGPGRP